ISNSYAGQKYLVERVGVDPRRVRVMPNGFDFETARGWQPRSLHSELGLDPAQPVVGMVARLTKIKNPSLFFEAAAQVRRHLLHTHFVVIGDGPLKSELEALIAARGLERHATLFGERPDAVNLIPSFAAGVLTSQSEGLPNALLEYMFWGCPSVVTDVGDCSRLVAAGEGGVVGAPGDLRGPNRGTLHPLLLPTLA